MFSTLSQPHPRHNLIPRGICISSRSLHRGCLSVAMARSAALRLLTLMSDNTAMSLRDVPPGEAVAGGAYGRTEPAAATDGCSCSRALLPRLSRGGDPPLSVLPHFCQPLHVYGGRPNQPKHPRVTRHRLHRHSPLPHHRLLLSRCVSVTIGNLSEIPLEIELWWRGVILY